MNMTNTNKYELLVQNKTYMLLMQMLWEHKYASF